MASRSSRPVGPRDQRTQSIAIPRPRAYSVSASSDSLMAWVKPYIQSSTSAWGSSRHRRMTAP